MLITVCWRVVGYFAVSCFSSRHRRPGGNWMGLTIRNQVCRMLVTLKHARSVPQSQVHPVEKPSITGVCCITDTSSNGGALKLSSCSAALKSSIEFLHRNSPWLYAYAHVPCIQACGLCNPSQLCLTSDIDAATVTATCS